jgi:hypothetical protein
MSFRLSIISVWSEERSRELAIEYLICLGRVVIKKSRTSGCLLICVSKYVGFVGDIILRLRFIIRLLKV